MPLRKHRTVAAALIATAFALAVPASAAQASGDRPLVDAVLQALDRAETCGMPDGSQYFSRWDDPNNYNPAPNAGFETAPATPPSGARAAVSSVPGWNILGRAEIVRGNEPFDVLPGSNSLRTSAGSVVTSPPFCVDKSMPHFRYMYSPRSVGAVMLTVIEFRDPASSGLLWRPALSLVNADLTPGSWSPSEFSKLGVKIPSVAWLGDKAIVRIKFITLSGEFQLDNVLVDPYRTR